MQRTMQLNNDALLRGLLELIAQRRFARLERLRAALRLPRLPGNAASLA